MKNSKYFYASSVRMMRYLYALGFEKESFINQSGYENWKFLHSETLQECIDFYFAIRKRNKELIDGAEIPGRTVE